MLAQEKIVEELRDIETQIEQGGGTPALSARYKKCIQRLYAPTLREETIGIRRGGLTNEETDAIQMKQSIKEMLKLLEG